MAAGATAVPGCFPASKAQRPLGSHRYCSIDDLRCRSSQHALATTAWTGGARNLKACFRASYQLSGEVGKLGWQRDKSRDFDSCATQCTATVAGEIDPRLPGSSSVLAGNVVSRDSLCTQCGCPHSGNVGLGLDFAERRGWVANWPVILSPNLTTTTHSSCRLDITAAHSDPRKLRILETPPPPFAAPFPAPSKVTCDLDDLARLFARRSCTLRHISCCASTMLSSPTQRHSQYCLAKS